MVFSVDKRHNSILAVLYSMALDSDNRARSPVLLVLILFDKVPFIPRWITAGLG